MDQRPTGPRLDCATPIPRRFPEGLADRADSAVHVASRTASEATLRDLNQQLERRLHERTQQLQALACQLANAEERERRRLASVLHDDLQQILVGAKLHLQLAVGRARRDPSLSRTLTLVSRLLEEAIAKSRSLSHDLATPLLHQHGLSAAIRWLARHMEAEHGLNVTLDLAPNAEPHTHHEKTLVYDATRELLFNVVKYSGVKEAAVTARSSPQGLMLTVADCGRGFDPRTLIGAMGLGLPNLRDRLEALGGRLDIQSSPGRGCQVTLLLPLRAPHPAPPHRP